MLLSFSTILWLYLCSHAFGARPGPANLSKIKATLSKARVQGSRFAQREKLVLEKRKEKLKQSEAIDSNKNRIDDDDVSIIELFARRSDIGHWTFFKEIAAGVDVKPLAEAVLEGGTAAESAKPQLDSWTLRHLYGVGMGEPVELLNEMKASLPQFKKIKPRHIQLGYKLRADSGDISLLDKSAVMMKHTPKHLRDAPIPEKVNLEDVLEQSRSIGELDIENVKKKIAEIVQFCIENCIDEILISVDGSATQSGTSCVLASAGVFVVPCCERTTSLDKPLPNLSLRVEKAAPISDNPFDAEIVAGVAGIVVADLIKERLQSLSMDNTKFVTCCTDSRALCRVLRRAVDDSSSSNRSILLAISRNLLGVLNSSSYDKISSVDFVAVSGESNKEPSLVDTDENNDMDAFFVCEWTAGHPERRETSIERLVVIIFTKSCA